MKIKLSDVYIRYTDMIIGVLLQTIKVVCYLCLGLYFIFLAYIIIISVAENYANQPRCAVRSYSGLGSYCEEYE